MNRRHFLATTSLPRWRRRSGRGRRAAAPHPAALVVADGEHRRHRAHAGRAGAAGEAPARRRGAAVGLGRPVRRRRGDGAPAVPEAEDRQGQHRRDGKASNAELARRSSGATSCCTAPGRRWWRPRTWPRSRSKPASPTASTASRTARSAPATTGTSSAARRFVFFRDSVSLARREGRRGAVPGHGVRPRRRVRLRPAQRRGGDGVPAPATDSRTGSSSAASRGCATRRTGRSANGPGSDAKQARRATRR